MRFLTEFNQLISHIWQHPGNRRARIQAILRLFSWQFRKRFLGKPIVIDTVFGRKFKIMPDSMYSSLVYYTRLPDWDEMKFLSKILSNETGFIDIGANVGFYTLLASASCRPENIWAAEALPVNLKVLRDQLALNKLEDIHILPYAIGVNRGVVHFSAKNRETGTVSPRQTPATIAVPASPLDDLLRADALPVRTVAKMDVEGCEVDVLLGAEKLLQSGVISVWLFELSEPNLANRGRTAHDLLDNFRRHHYTFWAWSEDSLSLLQIDPLAQHKANILAIHREAAWVKEKLQSASHAM